VTLQDVGNIGELLGAIGVIASLAYLAVQVRQNTVQIESNTRATRAASYQAMIDLISSMNLSLSSNPEFAELMLRARHQVEPLSPSDEIRWRTWMTAMLLQVENVHYQHGAGTLEASRVRVAMPMLDYYMQFQRTREVWALMRDRFEPPFRDEVDAMAARYWAAPGPPQTPLATRPPS
jgi:hypothetical protein